MLRPPPPSLPRSLPVAERAPLFLGLVRPPKLLGLPIMYAMVWLFGSVLLFVWVQHIAVLAVAVLLYLCFGRPQIGTRVSST